MPKHKEPEYIATWREWTRSTPACCHTCEHYNDDGLCEKHGMEPPEDFAAEHCACADWIMDLPF